MNQVAEQVKAAAEVVVGMGVLGFQRAQVERRALMRRLEGPRSEAQATLDGLRSQLEKGAGEFDHLVAPLRSKLDEGLRQIEHAVPPAGREAVHRIDTEARNVVAEIRKRLAD